MKDGITSGDVRKESISQSLAFSSTLHQTGDIDNIQIRWHFAVIKEKRKFQDSSRSNHEHCKQYLAGLW